MNARTSNTALKATPNKGRACAGSGGGGCCCCGNCGCDSRCCELECLVRPNFFCGQLLTDADLAALVEWTRKRLALARYRDGWGIVCGFDLSCSVPDGGAACCDDPQKEPVVYLNNGYAVDCCGNDLVVCEPIRIDLSSVCTTPDDPCNPNATPHPGSTNTAPNPVPHPGSANAAPNPAVGRGGCLVADFQNLFAVQVSLRYHEDLSHGQRAMFRGGCSDEGPCEYSRVLEQPCVFLEEIPLGAADTEQKEEEEWLQDFRAYTLRELSSIRGLLVQGFGVVSQYLARNPPYQMCFLPEMVCCLRDEIKPVPANMQTARTAIDESLATLGVYILIDRVLRRLQCVCHSCRPDKGVPLGRVLMRRVAVAGKTQCKVVAIDQGLRYRRLLRKDFCRPISAGKIDLAPYLWQLLDDAQPRLRSLGASVETVRLERARAQAAPAQAPPAQAAPAQAAPEQAAPAPAAPAGAAPGAMGSTVLDEKTSPFADQVLSFDPSTDGQLIAHTVIDFFGDMRIAAFRSIPR